MSVELTGLVCLITGAGAGVGKGLVHGFLKRGARVAAGLRSLDKSRDKVLPALPLQMDVTKSEEVKAAVSTTVAEFGRIDVLINNAGIYPRQPADEMTFDEWRRILDLNLDGAFRCCEAVIPHMKFQQSGVIINVGSITLQAGFPNLTHYLASKGGLVGLTRGLARDLGQYNLRVNCLHLGAIETEGEHAAFSDPVEVLKRVNEKQCIPGRLTPESIEPTFAFFASRDSFPITGQCLTLDQGWVHG